MVRATHLARVCCISVLAASCVVLEAHGRWLPRVDSRTRVDEQPHPTGVPGDAQLELPSRGLLRDVGLGLRLGNSRSALGNVLHIDVAYPLDGDAFARQPQFLVETKKSF